VIYYGILVVPVSELQKRLRVHK